MKFRVLMAIILCIASIFTASCDNSNTPEQTPEESTVNEFEGITVNFPKGVKGYSIPTYEEYLNFVNNEMKDQLPQHWIPYDAIRPFGQFNDALFLQIKEGYDGAGKCAWYIYSWEDEVFREISLVISHTSLNQPFDVDEYDSQVLNEDIDPQKMEKLSEEKNWQKQMGQYVYKEFTYVYRNGIFEGLIWERNGISFFLSVVGYSFPNDLSRENFLFQFLNLETVEDAVDSLIIPAEKSETPFYEKTIFQIGIGAAGVAISGAILTVAVVIVKKKSKKKAEISAE